MPLRLCFLFLGLAWSCPAQNSQPLEAHSTPFDFDNYRRTPLQARQMSSSSLSSKPDRDLHKQLLYGEGRKSENISSRAGSLFPDSDKIPLQPEPERLPTRRELSDQVTVETYGETTKGQKDLLARGRVENQLKLTTMSEPDYKLYAARHQASQRKDDPTSGEALLRPMPTVMNSKTGGPPHAYAVSQAGVGARTEPRDGQNPFEDLIRALRLDQPVTKGTDPLPAASSRTIPAGSQISAPVTTQNGAVPADQSPSADSENSSSATPNP